MIEISGFRYAARVSSPMNHPTATASIGTRNAVAVALRNRYRRQLLPEEMRAEVVPKNILMMGPTGVGKTEIARRVAKIVDAPFVKVEATKFTEVGYVGRDVESIVRDLCEVAIDMLHGRRLEQVKEEADQAARQRLVDLLTEQLISGSAWRNGRRGPPHGGPRRPTAAEERRRKRERDRLLALLNEEALEEETVEIDVDPQFADSPFEAVGAPRPLRSPALANSCSASKSISRCRAA